MRSFVAGLSSAFGQRLSDYISYYNYLNRCALLMIACRVPHVSPALRDVGKRKSSATLKQSFQIARTVYHAKDHNLSTFDSIKEQVLRESRYRPSPDTS